MKLVYLLGFLCLVAAGSAKKGINEEEYYKRNKNKKIRIAGGSEAFVFDMPYMATFIKKGPMDILISTAVIIQPFWVLMTATFLEHIDVVDHNFLKNGNYVIRSNTAFADGGSDMCQDHAIEEWHIKHLDNATDSNITRRTFLRGVNLGLVKVKTEFKGEYEKPINIVPRDYKYNVGSRAFQAGWGFTETTNGPSRKLMVTNTRLTDYEKCRRFYQYFPSEEYRVPNDMICTFAHGKRPCLGDSGGPLIQDGKLIGILGYDKPCDVTDWPAVYTKISIFVGWIEDTVSNVPN